MATVKLDTLGLHDDKLRASSQPHLLRDAACHRLLLRDRHRDPLAAFRATAAQHFAATSRFLAGTKTMRAFAALVMWLVGTLAHGRGIDTQPISGCQAESVKHVCNDRDRSRSGSSIAVVFGLRSEIAICYQRNDFSCGQVGWRVHGGAPEEAVNNFWIGCSLPVVYRLSTARNNRTLVLELRNDATATLG